MAKPSSDFPQRLIDSQLIDSDLVRQYLSQLQAGRGPVTEKEFAIALVKAGELTSYQARAVYQGKGNNLILGNYAILDKIGVGGMGHIYRAEHRRMSRVVALKILPPEVTCQENAVNRFHREVKAAARLSHPNIVMAFDADVAKGLHFLVMEYVDGTDLSTFVKENGPLSLERAVNCILQAARGLEYAHSQNVIHRDVKPGNLILDRFEMVKILDMGLARLNDSIRSASNISLTKTNVVMGTVDYMSPEQAYNSKYVDGRADIYSLGISLYYLLTGQPAYGGASAVERLIAHREAPLPSLTEGQSEADPGLNAIFQRMIAKKPDERYQSMTEVIDDLVYYSTGRRPTRPNVAPVVDEDENMKAFLLNLETIPAFVPWGSEEQFETARGSSASKSTDPDRKYLNFEQTIDRETIIGLPLAAKDKSDSSSWHSRSKERIRAHQSLTIIGAVLAMSLVLLLLDFGGTRLVANKILPASVQPDPVESLPEPPAEGNLKQPDPVPNLTEENSAQQQPAAPVSFELQETDPGRTPTQPVAYALHFNGRGQYAEIPNLNLGDIPLETPLTIEVKVRADSMQERGGVVSWLGSHWIGICQLTDDDGQHCWAVTRRIENQSVVRRAPATVRPGEWVEIAAVWDGREFTLFLDGKKQETLHSVRPAEATEGGIFLGGTPVEKHAGPGWFDGAIAQIRITQGALYEHDYQPGLNYPLTPEVLLLCDFHLQVGDAFFDKSLIPRHGFLHGVERKLLADIPW